MNLNFLCSWKYHLLGWFPRVWIKKNSPVKNPFRDCQQLIVDNISTFFLIPNYNNEKSVISVFRKRIWPSIEPCGTPAKTGFYDDFCSFKTTLWNLCKSYFSKKVLELSWDIHRPDFIKQAFTLQMLLIYLKRRI